MNLLLSLLLPLLPVLISASGPNKGPTRLNRRDGGCDILEIVTDDTDLVQCGPPGWGIEPDCTCCYEVTACVNVIQTCGTANGVPVCYGYGAYPTPSAAATSNSPIAPSNSPVISISSQPAPISSPAAPTSPIAPSNSPAISISSQVVPTSTDFNSAQSLHSTATAPIIFPTTAAASSPTSSKGPNPGPPGKSAASKGLQRADIIKVAFATGLLLVFGDFV